MTRSSRATAGAGARPLPSLPRSPRARAAWSRHAGSGLQLRASRDAHVPLTATSSPPPGRSRERWADTPERQRGCLRTRVSRAVCRSNPLVRLLGRTCVRPEVCHGRRTESNVGGKAVRGSKGGASRTQCYDVSAVACSRSVSVSARASTAPSWVKCWRAWWRTVRGLVWLVEVDEAAALSE